MQPDSILPFFANFIESELGIIYADHNYFQLQNRLEEIAHLLGVKTIEALYEQAQNGIFGQFRQLLLDVATNNETSFFRDPKIFRLMEKMILPEMKAKLSGFDTLKIWSAASSTGQEAITTAITISDWCAKNSATLNFEIKGTDVSERVLARAKAAKYSQLEVQRGMPAPYLIKYFTKDDQDQWTAKPEITKHLHFSKLNLKESFSFPEKFDLVLCRNMLIYQSVESKIDILKRITANLADDGFLILGSGESLLGLSQDYEQVNVDSTVIYRKKNQKQKVA